MLDQDSYNHIKTKLVIDPVRLTEELVELPQYQSDASEAVAECQRVRDEAKDYLEITIAGAAANIRYDENNAKKPSEAQIESELLLNEEVQTAMETLRDAEYNLNLWKALADGLRSKSFAISKIADLIQSGYTTPTSLYAERRTNIDRERKQLVQRGVT